MTVRGSGAGKDGSWGGGRQPCGRSRRQFGAGSVAVVRASSFGARGGTGCPCFARVSRVRARGAAGAYRGGAVHAPDCPRETAGGEPLPKCHEMSCDAMEAVRCAPLPLGGRSWGRASRRDGPLPGFARRFRWRESGPPPGLPRERGRRLRAACGRFRRQLGAGVGCGHACLLRGKGRDGCPCFARVSRVRACGGAGGRIAAARLVRLIARARRQAHLARPFPPGSFSRPQPSLSAEKPKGGPRGAASLYFHSITLRFRSSPCGNKK